MSGSFSRLAGRPAEPRHAWVVLGLAMGLASALILWAGRGTSLSGDDLFYYARLIEEGRDVVPYGFGLEYLLAPHNGHLQLTGKLIYEAVFGTVGTSYIVLRLVELAGILICVALFFELARRRAGSAVGLAASILILFLGAAWELMIWPFDLHSTYALAAGLGAMLALERGGRRSDFAACALLVLSTATIEIGLAFSVGVGVSVLLRPDRLRRLWVPGIPLVLYAIWALWARDFDQSGLGTTDPTELATSVFDSLRAVAGSLSGQIEAGPGVFAYTVDPSAVATLFAVLVTLGLIIGIARGRVPPTLWALLATLLVYWGFVAAAERPPDSSRYMLAGSILLLLVLAETLRETRPSYLAVGAVSLVVLAVALPNNIEKLFDGRSAQVGDASVSRTQYAMLELARPHLDPGYAPAFDRQVVAAGPRPFFGLEAGTYAVSAARFGSLAYDLEQVRAQEERYRVVADVLLADGLEVGLRATSAPGDTRECRIEAPATEGAGVAIELPPGGAAVRSLEPDSNALGLSRFATATPNVQLGELPQGWARLELPADGAPDAWRLFATDALRVCPLGPPPGS